MAVAYLSLELLNKASFGRSNEFRTLKTDAVTKTAIMDLREPVFGSFEPF
jgi:hypothetical protein